MNRVFPIAIALTASLILPAAAEAKPDKPFTWHGLTWNPYHGHGRLGQHWTSQNIRVNKHDRLVFHASKDAGAGAALTTDQVYGKFSVRFRMDAGTGSKYVLLLWPASGLRPEVDFAESWKNEAGEQRLQLTASYHPTLDPASVSQWVAPFGDYSQWHVASVVWRSDKLVFKLDGAEWGRYTGNAVPNQPMHLAIQATRYSPGPSTGLRIARVRIRP